MLDGRRDECCYSFGGGHLQNVHTALVAGHSREKFQELEIPPLRSQFYWLIQLAYVKFENGDKFSDVQQNFATRYQVTS